MLNNFLQDDNSHSYYKILGYLTGLYGNRVVLSNGTIRFYHLGLVNVNSLLSKLDYITEFAGDYMLDIVAVTETHLIQSVSSFIALEGYSVVRGDIHGLIRKHGVCLYCSGRKFFDFN